MSYLSLVSGSDLRGVSIDIGAGVTLGGDEAAMACAAFARFLRKKLGKAALTVAVGHDPRLSAQKLYQGAAKGFAAENVKVKALGLSTTPAMFMATLELDVDAAVMLTASHLPYERNGLKFITQEGGLSAKEVTAIAEDMRPVASAQPQVENVDYLPRYAEGLVRFIREKTGQQMPLKGKKIIVDAGNGSGGFFAEKVLAPLGADTTGSIALAPDGHFPTHIPNPELPAAMEAVAKATVAAHADLGVIFDADCDRAALVDASGKAINRNRLIAALAAASLKHAPGGTIVTDSVTSLGLTRFIAAKGGTHRRFKRGYKNVIDEAKRLNAEGIDCPFAIETSGHCAFRENHYLDDGAYAVCHLLVSLQGQTLEQLLEGYEEPAEEKELRFKLLGDDFKSVGQKAIAAMKQAVLDRPDWRADEDYEGVRALITLPGGGEGYILVRLSLHDPVLPVNFEASTKGGVALLEQQLQQVIGHIEGIAR